MTYYWISKPNRQLDERTSLMPFSLRQIPDDDKMCHQVGLHVLQDLCPRELVAQVLERCHAWEERERQLNMLTVVYLLIALHLFPRHNQAAVLEELASGLRFVWPDEPPRLAGASAISYRRQQLRIPCMRLLFQHICQPMATQATKGAFGLGYRLMAVDGTLDNVIETPENALHFGRLTDGDSASPCPQVRAVYLAECGTPAIIDAVLAPCRFDERYLVTVLLRSIQSDMLVLLDRGIFSGHLFLSLRQKGAHALARLQAGMLSRPESVLSDGSSLLWLTPRTCRGLSHPFQVRVIEYRFADPAMPNAQETHRLVTTLLDPVRAPAEDLIVLYHERWEIESIIDEHKNHQRLSQHSLRSRTPQGVFQELYGLLIAHYAVRSLMHQAAVEAELDPDRLSFTRALQLVTRAVHEFAQAAPQEHEALMKRLRTDLRAHLVPPRPLRFNPRVVKRAHSKFRRKRFFHFDCPPLKGSSFREVLLI